MTTPVPDRRPPSSVSQPGATTPPAPVSHPVAPTPPRSRVGAHVLSLFAALVLTPIALACLGGGARAVTAALAADQDPSPAAFVAVLSAAALLGVVAATSAGSAAGPLVGGTLYGLVPGIAFLIWPATSTDVATTLFEPVRTLGGDRVLDGLLTLARMASLLVLGLVLVLVGAAATVSRRGGRTTERAEARAVADRSAPYPAQPVPPRTRRLDHAVSLVLGLVVTPVALVLIAAGSAEVAEAAQRGDPATAGLLIGSGLLGAGLLAVVVLSAGWSTLGLLVGALAYAVLPGLLGLISTAWSERGVAGLLIQVGDVLDPVSQAGLHDLISLGVLLAWGSAGAFGALGVHGARRDGRRRERAELAVRRASARPAG